MLRPLSTGSTQRSHPLKAVRSRRSARGVMLIEALIAILIFSVGILALVGLQSRAVSQTTDARYRSEAAFLANEIVGRIWSDGLVNSAQYAHPGGASTAKTEWVSRVQSTLPGVSASSNAPAIVVAALGADGAQVTVTVNWRAPSASASNRHTVVANLYWNAP
jgi:type IV pilus assembly protein PilV